MVPEFAPGPLLLKLTGLNSIESEVTTKKLLFLGRLITEPKMTPLIAESLKKFDLFCYFETWYNNSIFSTYPNWKNIVRDNILHFEKSAWHSYCDTHPEMQNC